jgi:hypothetical protein
MEEVIQTYRHITYNSKSLNNTSHLVFLVDISLQYSTSHFCRVENGHTVMDSMGSCLTVPVYVAKTREPLRLSRGDLDPRFPNRLLNKVINTDHIF